jgi:hypothetical protein
MVFPAEEVGRRLRALVERGLHRVYVGWRVATTRRWPGWRRAAADAVRAVRQMKAGGADVGVIAMLGWRRTLRGRTRATRLRC